ncbi:unnamed protein product [Clavelina lepadiformis]|uniref:Uncharacterized protein n=1 Tax=Clavelina lepadiformis TaxID=159417 RepID=A0ABP0FJD5_CLALP
MVFSTKFGLTVDSNGNRIIVILPSTYKEMINGLCGNYNDDESDDLEKSDATTTDDVNEFGDSHQVGDCGDETPDPIVCSPEDKEKWNRLNFCGAMDLLDDSCKNSVDFDTYKESCLFDACATDGNEEVITQIIESLIKECQEHDVKVCNWRQILNRPGMECLSNSHYEGCASPCTDTCANPTASSDCSIPGTVEDCVCNEGYIKDCNRCIPTSECGSVVDGTYVSNVCPTGVPNPVIPTEPPIMGCLKPYLPRRTFDPDKPVYDEGDTICVRCEIGTRIARVASTTAMCRADGNLKARKKLSSGQCEELPCLFEMKSRIAFYRTNRPRTLYSRCQSSCRTFTAHDAKFIKLQFIFFELEGSTGSPILQPGDKCEHDWMQIKDGDKLSERFCGSDVPSDYISTNNSVTIFFTSDNEHEFKGFLVRSRHLDWFDYVAE